MNNSRALCLLIALLFSMQASIVRAQEHGHEAAAKHDETHEVHSNVLAFLVGVTAEGRDDALTLGIEYERRLNPSFGIGVLAERVLGDLDFWVFAVPFAYHNGPWKLYAAPGVERGEDGSESMLRLGGEYGFEVGDWEIAPQIDVDFVNGEEVFVLGVTFGKGF